jgi:HAD superfamily hydrolase (TIGR01509 family)
MDGVLVDNSPYYAAAWERFLAEHPDVKLPDYPAEKTFGRRNDDLLPEVFGRDLSRQELDRLGNRLEETYRQLFAANMRPLPGLEDFIDELRRGGIRLALATSAPAPNVTWITRELRLTDVFDVVLSQRDVTQGKPDPQIYRKAIVGLGCRADQCVVFEDAMIGVRAARAAGARCIGVATTFPPEPLIEAGAERVIHDFRDISADQL